MTPEAKNLLDWYDKRARVLPWRSDPTPYRVWVSEIMLQQTRVEAVLPYFERFLAALPDIAALAAVPEDELYALWQGLGYYSRVRNLQRAAQWCCEHNNCQLPATFAGLRQLPGIGEYTAGAIASIAFGLPEVAVDGNVVRVVSRLDGLPGGPMTLQAPVREQVRAMQPHSRPGDFNQALMELGAIVCLPNGAPLCDACPWRERCVAHAAGRELSYPAKKEKPPRRMEERLVLLVTDGSKILLHKRPDKGLLASLWEFPNEPLHGRPTDSALEDYARAQGFTPLASGSLPPARHIFTHLEWHMQGRWLRIAQDTPAPPGHAWAEPYALAHTYALPSAFKTYRSYALDLLKPGRTEP